MKSRNKIIYSINIDDVQTVALEELERPLTEEETKLVEEKLGDYLDWYGAIALAIGDVVGEEEDEEE